MVGFKWMSGVVIPTGVPAGMMVSGDESVLRRTIGSLGEMRARRETTPNE